MAKRKAIKKSISLPEEVLEDALAKAKREHRSLSSYITAAVAKDLEGGLVIEQSDKAAA